MFDIGFWELTLIATVTLIVVGPERMPALARTAGKWFGRITRFVGNVKSDIDRELKAEEMKRAMERHTAAVGMHEIIEETQADLKEIEQSAAEAVDETSKVVQEAEGSTAESTTHDFDDDADDGDEAHK